VDEVLHAEIPRRLEHVQGPEHVHPDDRFRVPRAAVDAGGREVEHDPHAAQLGLDPIGERPRQIGGDDGRALVEATEPPRVCPGPHHREYPLAQGRQTPDQVRPDEPARAGDERTPPGVGVAVIQEGLGTRQSSLSGRTPSRTAAASPASGVPSPTTCADRGSHAWRCSGCAARSPGSP
jgi:hypothetical protein